VLLNEMVVYLFLFFSIFGVPLDSSLDRKRVTCVMHFRVGMFAWLCSQWYFRIRTFAAFLYNI